MPVRLPSVHADASRLLLDGVIDYAGVFPPAALALPAAIRHYAHDRASGAGWMLGRFVCPATALEQFSEEADPFFPRDAGAIPWRISVTGSGDLAADLAAIAAFNERHRVCFDECGAVVDSYEVRVTDAQAIETVAAAVPPEIATFLELPLDRADALMPAVAATGRRAKMRTGGITPEAFPTPDAILRFLQVCIDHGVAAKATAGLHHPVCGTYRLTYEEGGPHGPMFGHLNLLLAAAALSRGTPVAVARALLTESDATRLRCDATQVTWNGDAGVVALDREAVAHTRASMLVSIGSCSFAEPVDELRAIGWI